MLLLFAGVGELNVALAVTRKPPARLCRKTMPLIRQFSSNSLVLLLLLLSLAALKVGSVSQIEL
jgi:hypothetical protein